MRVDREAIARALVNLVNNALKYSADDKFLGVKLYRANDLLKLEVVDRGIGITRREQSKIFEKFYRTGDHWYTTRREVVWVCLWCATLRTATGERWKWKAHPEKAASSFSRAVGARHAVAAQWRSKRITP